MRQTKKTPKAPSTQKDWFELALFYCSKRETSRSRLRSYFLRKLKAVQRSEEEVAQALEQIEKALDECERLKIIDDERYAGMLGREYARRGKGSRYIINQLYAKGLKEEIKNLTVNPDEEMARAQALVEKSLKRALFQKITDPRMLRLKLMQKLIAAGFDLSLAKNAIESMKVNRQNDTDSG